MPDKRSKTALVLSGGGIMGAAYQIGCLTALDRLFCPGFSTRQFDTYIGVSAGAVIATLMANRIRPAGLYRTIAQNESSVFNWRRSDIYHFNWWASLIALLKLPYNLFSVYLTYRRNNWAIRKADFPHILHEQFPAGLFSLGPMQNYLCNAFHSEGVCDSFDDLQPELLIPAYDLDTGDRVVFGQEPFRDLHLCQAITASCAIPFFFQPYEIEKHAYLDGSIGRVTHIDLAIESGAKLVLMINPRVPIRNDPEKSCLPSLSSGKCSQVHDLGVLFAWEQSQRIGARSKMRMSLNYHQQKHPDVDIALFEPSADESLLFFQSPMSITARFQVMRHGYHLTLAELNNRYDHYADLFASHGIATRHERLKMAPPFDERAADR